MGRIKTRLVKAVTMDVVEKHRDELTTDFEKNKEVISSKLDAPSKKIRNIIAGYATRMKKAEQKEN